MNNRTGRSLLKIADSMSGRQVAPNGLLKPRNPDTVYDWVIQWRPDFSRDLRASRLSQKANLVKRYFHL